MVIKDQTIREKYAIYNGDCIEVMGGLPENSVDFIIYSPPFASMYTYSSSDRDLGNNKNYAEFLEHYTYVIKETAKILKPGRLMAVHCMDIPKSGDGGILDFPGDIIKLHQDNGFKYWDRKNIWKEPLRVAIRTRQRALMHGQLCKDTSKCRGALADYLLIFKKKGDNLVPIQKPFGLTSYDGDLELMNVEERREYDALIEQYVNFADDRTNKLSQFIWRRYASSAWEDIRANRACSYKAARDPEDDRHVCPLQLDIITRAIILYTNPEEVVFSPFAGVGSELFGAVINGRKAVGAELKESYYRQAVKNLLEAETYSDNESGVDLFSEFNDEDFIEAE
jgi:DNA modification methylase